MTVHNTTASGTKTKLMAVALTYGQMVVAIRAIGKKTICTEEVFILGKMVVAMRAST